MTPALLQGSRTCPRARTSSRSHAITTAAPVATRALAVMNSNATPAFVGTLGIEVIELLFFCAHRVDSGRYPRTGSIGRTIDSNFQLPVAAEAPPGSRHRRAPGCGRPATSAPSAKLRVEDITRPIGRTEIQLCIEPITRSFRIELNRESIYASTSESSILAVSEDEPTNDS